jgi:EpsI family protein
MTRGARYASVALALIGLTALVTTGAPRVGATGLRAPLESIPRQLARWEPGFPPTSPAFKGDVNAGDRLARGYEGREGPVWIAVDYYPEQAERHRPAPRELLFPNQGWTELQERRVVLPLGDGATLDANLVVMRAEKDVTAVLYWYQLGSHPVASDHWYRAALVYHRLVRRRADGALVRVGTPLAAGDDVTAALARQSEFIRALQPHLLAVLPG